MVPLCASQPSYSINDGAWWLEGCEANIWRPSIYIMLFKCLWMTSAPSECRMQASEHLNVAERWASSTRRVDHYYWTSGFKRLTRESSYTDMSTGVRMLISIVLIALWEPIDRFKVQKLNWFNKTSRMDAFRWQHTYLKAGTTCIHHHINVCPCSCTVRACTQHWIQSLRSTLTSSPFFILLEYSTTWGMTFFKVCKIKACILFEAFAWNTCVVMMLNLFFFFFGTQQSSVFFSASIGIPNMWIGHLKVTYYYMTWCFQEFDMLNIMYSCSKN